MKIVIDTSPLISLAVLDHLELLKKLFPTIISKKGARQKKSKKSQTILLPTVLLARYGG